VLDVIDTVKRVAGVDFKVELAPRRAGDPAQIVAACDRVRSTLGWQPRFDDLQTIVAHALAWERKLSLTQAALSQPGGHIKDERRDVPARSEPLASPRGASRRRRKGLVARSIRAQPRRCQANPHR
jgi:hypothetical protein